MIDLLLSPLFLLLPYLSYVLRALVVVAFWWFMVRKRLFGAAMLQMLGFPLFGTYAIPVIPGVFALQLGYALALVLLVEAFRQGIHKRIMKKSRGATFVKLMLALFAVSVASYLVKGTEEFSDPVGALINRFTSVALPVSIVALAWEREELYQGWRWGLKVSMVITVIYLIAAISGMTADVTGFDLREVKVLNYGLVGGGNAALWLLILSAYAPVFSKQQLEKLGALIAITLLVGPLLTMLSSNRTLVILLPVTVALILLIGRRQGTSNNILGVMLGTGAMILAGGLLLLVRPAWSHGVTEAYDVLRGRFRGEYGAEEGSGRFAMWQQAWQLFLKDAILGAGEANSGTLSTTYLKDEERLHTFRIAQHSVYFKYLGEQGIIGAGLLLSIMFSFFANAARAFSRPISYYATAVVARGAFVLGVVGIFASFVGGELLFFTGAAVLAASLSIEARMLDGARRGSANVT